ncbi:MAG: 6-bladed beta-propeller [Deltaproteobacteria bacterium]|nr:MAG: 6-bladed beta-propeller [Deltaproteobacteria bacterium]
MVRTRILIPALVLAVFLSLSFRGEAVEFRVLRVVKSEEFKRPVDVGVDGRGYYYVLDSEGKSVFVISPQGEIVRRVPLPAGTGKPEGIDVVRPGVFLVADSTFSALHEVGISGRRFRKISIKRMGRFVDVCHFGKRYFFLDGKDHVIYIVGNDGKVMRKVGDEGTKPGEFKYPYRISCDENGRVYVSDTMNARVQVLDVDGKHIETIKRFGLAGDSFLRPAGVASYGVNRVLLTDVLSGYLLLWDGQRREVSAATVRGKRVRFSYPASVTVSRYGDVAVVDSVAKELIIMRQL